MLVLALCLIYFCSQESHLKKLDTIQRIAAHIIYEVPRDKHAEPLLILLNLEQFGVQRECHLVKLMNSFVSGNCHSAMKVKQLVKPKPCRWSPLSTSVQDSSWRKTSVGDRC